MWLGQINTNVRKITGLYIYIFLFFGGLRVFSVPADDLTKHDPSRNPL